MTWVQYIEILLVLPGVAYAIASWFVNRGLDVTIGEPGVHIVDDESVPAKLRSALAQFALQAVLCLVYALPLIPIVIIAALTTGSLIVPGLILLLAGLVAGWWLLGALGSELPQPRPRIFLAGGHLWARSLLLSADRPETLRFKHALPGLQELPRIRARLVAFHFESNARRHAKIQDASFPLEASQITFRDGVLAATIELRVPSETVVAGHCESEIVSAADASASTVVNGSRVAFTRTRHEHFQRPFSQWRVEVYIETERRGVSRSSFTVRLARYGTS